MLRHLYTVTLADKQRLSSQDLNDFRVTSIKEKYGILRLRLMALEPCGLTHLVQFLRGRAHAPLPSLTVVSEPKLPKCNLVN